MDLHCLQRQGIFGFSRTRVKLADEGDRDMFRVMSSRLMNVVDIE